MIQRKNTLQAANEVAEEAVDIDLKKRYGTSIEEYMSREHAKEIRKEIANLRQEFQAIDKDKDSMINKNELKEFFNKTNPSGEIYDDIYIDNVYKLIDKNSDNEITVNEFVESYVAFTEKLKIKNAKLERILIELNETMKRDKEVLKKIENEEKELDDGLTTNSNLYVTVYEARDLNSSSLISDCDAFVVLNYDGQRQQTLIKQSTNNPAWNENFKFPVKKKDLVLRIEVFDQTVMGSKLIGYVPISLNSFTNQEKVIKWFDLHIDGSTGNNGKIYLKIQYIYSLKKYYQQQIEKNQKNYIFLEKNFNMTSYFKDESAKPFGIIYSGKFNEYLNTDTLKQCDELIAIMEKGKSVVWANRPYEDKGRDTFTGKLAYAITGGNKVGWNKRTQFLMFLYIIITTITLLERKDFLNFFISFGILILYFYDKNNEALEYLQPMIIAIGFSIGYDVFWIILEYEEFFIGKEGDFEKGVKKFVYILSIIGSCIKLLLIGTLNSLKKKKIKASASKIFE